MTDQVVVWEAVQRVRRGSPLVHNITNFVVMNSVANALLAVGASPVMAHAREEMEEIVGISSALVLNIGTLSSPWVESMFVAGRAATKRGVPIVLDPVGAGASVLRTRTSLQLLLEVGPSVLRGNASEILALAGAGNGGKGVDSAHRVADAWGASRELAARYGCVVVTSGPEDMITDGVDTVLLAGGHEMMPRVTGMGCVASAIVGAHMVMASCPFEGAVTGMAAMATAGSMASDKAEGPGSFQSCFLDALYTMQLSDIAQGIAIRRHI